MTLQQQYTIAKERAERFMRANRLTPLWEGQAALDVVCLHTDVYQKGLTPGEKVRRTALRIEWLARIKSPPLNSIPFGYREYIRGETVEVL